MSKSTKPEVLTVEATDSNGTTQIKQIVVDTVSQDRREVVWQASGLNAENLPEVAMKNGNVTKTEMPIWYAMQILNSYRVKNAWNGKKWTLATTRTVVDPNPGKKTTYMSIAFIKQIFKRLHVKNVLNGTIWMLNNP